MDQNQGLIEMSVVVPRKGRRCEENMAKVGLEVGACETWEARKSWGGGGGKETEPAKQPNPYGAKLCRSEN